MRMDKKHPSFLSTTPLARAENKKMAQLLQALLDSPDSYEFRTPVDYLAFGLLDYPSIVRKPMDLGTIRKRLLSDDYQTVEECLSDVQLVWDNCKLYNLKDNVPSHLLSGSTDWRRNWRR